MNNWNPRFAMYAKAHGNTPEEQADADAIAWPGGYAVGFSLWIQERWREWKEINGLPPVAPTARHDDFDHWLSEKVGL